MAACDEGEASTRGALVEAVLRARLLRRVLVRRILLEQRRVDLFGLAVLGYDLRPFHIDMLRFQDAHSTALQLAPRGFGKSTVLNITRVLWVILAGLSFAAFVASTVIAMREPRNSR